eukprot:2239859-Prymnesium_polylepis.2
MPMGRLAGCVQKTTLALGVSLTAMCFTARPLPDAEPPPLRLGRGGARAVLFDPHCCVPERALFAFV